MAGRLQSSPAAGAGKRWLWFVALWLGGVLGAVAVATVFKILMLGAVKLS